MPELSRFFGIIVTTQQKRFATNYTNVKENMRMHVRRTLRASHCFSLRGMKSISIIITVITFSKTNY